MTAESTSPLPELGPAPRIILEGLSHRGELATLELTEARNHATVTAIFTALAAALVLLAGFAGTIAIAALVWHRDDRGLLLSLVTFIYLLGAGAFAWLAANRLKTWSPLTETRHQLGEDYVCIRQFFQGSPS